jgi:hypothetical protein
MADLADPAESFEQILQNNVKNIFEKVLQDEIGQSLRPNEFTSEADVNQMRRYYLDRASEIVALEVQVLREGYI